MWDDIVERLTNILPELRDLKEFLYFIVKRDELTANFEPFKADMKKVLEFVTTAFFPEVEGKLKEVISTGWDYALHSMTIEQIPLIAKVFREGGATMDIIGASYDNKGMLNGNNPLLKKIRELDVSDKLAKEFSEVEKAKQTQPWSDEQYVKVSTKLRTLSYGN